MSNIRTSLLLEQLDIHVTHDEWFASVATALRGTSASEAAWIPSGSANTIWQIVNHLIYCNEDVIHRVKGTKNPNVAQDNDETFGHPGNPDDESGWSHTLEHFHSTMECLRGVIAEIDDAKLDTSYRPDGPTIQRLLCNIMMHDTYHIGQIVQLRKIHASWPGFDWS